MLRRGFDVHGNIVQKPLAEKIFNDFRPIAVGIQFHQQPELLYFFEKNGQIRLQRRFSAGDADAGEDAAPFGKHLQNFRLVKLRKPGGMEDKVSVLAERTAEIAAARKNGGRHVAGIVQ